MKVELMSWDDARFSVKSEEVDNQHKKLVDMLNEFYSAFKEGNARNVLQEILARMVAYTVYHFGTEENYLTKYNTENCKLHIAEHKDFVSKVGDFLLAFEQNKTTVTYEVMKFLKDWLINHIEGSDMRDANYFIQN